MKKILPFFFFFSSFSFAQQNNIDSILSLLKKDKQDTTRVNTLNTLAFALHLSNPDSTILLAQQAVALAEASLRGRNDRSNLTEKQIASLTLAMTKGKANAYGTAGVGYWVKGDYPNALENYFAALKFDEAIGNKTGIAKRLGNIGLVYWNQADYPKALDYYFRALKMKEELGNKNEIAITLGNIGIVYKEQADYPKALDYYFRALKMDEELGNKNGIARHLGNIGIVYKEQADYPKALDYYFKRMKLDEESGNKINMAINLGNIGNVYKEQADYPKALDYYFRALKMAEELGDKNRISINLGNIGSIYTKTGKFKEAEKYLNHSLALCDSIGALDYTKEFELSLSQLYDTLGKISGSGSGSRQFTATATAATYFKLALEHYKKYITARDSITNDEQNKKQMRTEMNYEFEKKEVIAKAEQEKKDVIAKEELKQKEQQRNYFIIGFALVALLAGFIFRSLRVTRKQKNIIEIQKNEVSQQKEIVEQQKKIVEEHQKEIIDSITYAKRLQQAILPPIELIKKHFPNTFVLYKPKDIVAGDFYWMETIDNNIFIAAADCTGHGVPGAMVSVVCSNALNRTVKEFGLRDTGKILDKVTDLVLETFEKSGEQIKDGMDISLLAYNKTSKQIQWSGANNPLWYIQNGSMDEITADKQPIGKYDNRKPFTTHNIEHSDNSIFYLFTDGLPDQFGGPKGKKFMYKRFENNLTDISKLPIEEQQTILEKAFHDWKGNLEQVDDVTVIGIKI